MGTPASPERLTWFGHATVLIEIGGVRLLTDPVLRPRILHLRRHVPLPPLPEHLDAILISHLHYDHLDVKTLRALDPSAPVVVPRGAGKTRAVRALGRDVHELDEDGVISFGGAEVRAVPAVHDGRRLPLTPDQAAAGFVIAGERRVYYAGDTELFDDMRTIGGDDLDVALLPVWGWGPSLGPGHMDPDQAAQAAAMLRPAVAVPVHWGTLLPLGYRKRLDGLLRSPGTSFAEHVAERAPDVRTAVLAPGESLAL
jgi:L-ascorbate metabolism protein UlaG (beta-lactamase superfamily)